MDYEKAYKEALEQAKFYYGNCSSESEKKRLEKMFPELKESEDERVKKAIGAAICGSTAEIVLEANGVRLGDALAYLEKQKEQKPEIRVRIPKFRVGDIIQHIPLEKWDSSKKIVSIDEHGYNYNLSHLGDTVSGGAIGFAFENEYELAEQQPAEWSEDYRDEDLRTRFAFYTYKDEDDALYLSNVFVEETSRNKGFGTKILAAAEKVAETIGAINIRLKVKQDSQANAWYRKHGYGYMAFEGDHDWLEKTLEYLKPKQEHPEVDLDKETIIDYVHNHYHYDKDFDGYGHSNLRPVFTREDLTELASHFYELGLNARKEE